MPADPQPPFPPAVEAMLRDAARQRRAEFDAAGPGAANMPGPTRTRLHAEIARQFHAPPAPVAPRGIARWWPALVGFAGAATVAVVALFMVNGPPPPTPVAANVPTTPPDQAAPAIPAAPPEVAAAQPEITPVPLHGPQIAAASKDRNDVLDKSAREQTVVRAQTFAQNPPLPLARVAPVAPGVPPTLRAAPAAAARRDNTLATDGRRAAASAAREPNSPGGASPPSTPLLENFRFEQRGETVRVVDADGSVYLGQVEPVVTKALPDVSQAQAQKSAEDSPSNRAEENFRFRAAGDNRTLRKAVVFEGEYSVVVPDPANADQSKLKAAPAAPAPSKKAAPAPASEAQIRGRVRVLGGDGARDAEVDARSVNRP